MNTLLRLPLQLFTILLFSTTLIIVSYGQQAAIKFDRISFEQGLSQNTVRTIFQDKEGFMWFGTEDGLNKYDGYKIVAFRHNPDDTTTLVDNYINIIYEDSKGTLWIGTRSGGLCSFNKLTGSFINYKQKIETSEALQNSIKSIYEDNVTEKLLVGNGSGFSLFDTQSHEFQLFTTSKEGKEIGEVNRIIKGTDNTILLGAENGLFIFNIENKTIKQFYYYSPLKDGNYAIGNQINDLLLDSDNILWCATNFGLKLINLNNNELESYKTDTKDNYSISDKNINSLLKDKHGDLWIATEKGGLNRYVKKENKFYRYQHDPSDQYSISVDNILSLYIDRGNILWAGTYLGGVVKWDRSAQGVVLFRSNPFAKSSMSSSQIRSVYEDSNDTIWIGTVDNGLDKWNLKTNTFTNYSNTTNLNSLSDNHVRAILEDSRGNLWVGTDEGGLNLFDRKKETFTRFIYNKKNENCLPNNKIWSIIEDSKGRILIGTFGGGFCIVNYSENHKEITFQCYTNHESNTESLSDNKVTCLFEDHLGIIWIGTYGGGLNMWDEVSNQFIHYKYQKEDHKSLGNNRVYCIMEDSEENLWIGTKGSLNRFNRDLQIFSRFNEVDGLPNDVIMAILEDNQKNLWISTNNGISKFNPKDTSARNYDINNGLQSNEFLVGSYFKTKSGKMFFGGINGLNLINPDSVKNNPIAPQTVITDFKLYNKSVVPGEDSPLKYHITKTEVIELSYSQNAFSFEFVALHYAQPEKNRYAYKMINFDKEWNTTDAKQRFAAYTNLDPGRYKFKVLSANSDGVWDKHGTSIDIIIHPPFWMTLWFQITVGLFIAGSVYYWYRHRIARIEKQKKILEIQVRERTAEVEQQKEEIEAQRDELEEKNFKINKQHEQIKRSINYALTIQKAILPFQEKMDKIIETFIYYRPKDVISGDFFWYSYCESEPLQHGKVFLAVVDCSSSGLQGAFMSMIGNRLLSEIVNEDKILNPGKILEELNKRVINSLKQEQDDNHDSMKIVLCVLEKQPDKTTKVTYAGANQNLYFCNHANLSQHTLTATQASIGGATDADTSFEEQEIILKTGDFVYLTSDGVFNQLSPEGKRFGEAKLIEIMHLNSHLPISRLKDVLEVAIDFHKQETAQTDDITLLAVKI